MAVAVSKLTTQTTGCCISISHLVDIYWYFYYKYICKHSFVPAALLYGVSPGNNNSVFIYS